MGGVRSARPRPDDVSLDSFVAALEAALDREGQAAPGPNRVASRRLSRVTDLDLASRLLFFLRRSVPDDELLDVTAAGRLSDPTVLAQQINRMQVYRHTTHFMNNFVWQ